MIATLFSQEGLAAHVYANAIENDRSLFAGDSFGYEDHAADSIKIQSAQRTFPGLG